MTSTTNAQRPILLLLAVLCCSCGLTGQSFGIPHVTKFPCIPYFCCTAAHEAEARPLCSLVCLISYDPMHWPLIWSVACHGHLEVSEHATLHSQTVLPSGKNVDTHPGAMDKANTIIHANWVANCADCSRGTLRMHVLGGSSLSGIVAKSLYLGCNLKLVSMCCPWWRMCDQ